MITAAELDALIDELTVDAYTDEEHGTGFLVGAEEALVPGERARLLGIDIEVVKIDSGPEVRTGLRARVRGDMHEVALADLAFPDGGELGGRGFRVPAPTGLAMTDLAALSACNDAQKTAVLSDSSPATQHSSGEPRSSLVKAGGRRSG